MRQPNLETLKARIIDASEMEQHHLFRPLLLFHGNLSEGRAKALWNMTLSLMDAEVENLTDAVKLHGASQDLRHLCGLHAPPQRLTFMSFMSRLIQTPRVSGLVPGLRDYIRLVSNGCLYRLLPIPEFSFRICSSRTWRLDPNKPQRIPKPELPSFYPYISGEPTKEHNLLLAVEMLIPKSLPNDVRSDVCQDMIVAVLSGEASLDTLRGDWNGYLKKFWKMYPSKYGHISLDAPVPGTDNWNWNDKLDARTSRLVEAP
jgi:hypothetical protein